METRLKDSKVLVTKDYDNFVFMEGNRNVSPVHLTRIKRSLEEKQLPIPIIVTEKENGKLEIFEGQHRYTACRQLDLPIYYIIIENLQLEDAITINTISKKWTAEDYFQHYCTLKKEHYLLLRQFMEITGLTLYNARTFIDFCSSKGSKQTHDFNTGSFQVTDYNKSLDLYYKHLDYSDCPAFAKANCKLAILRVLNYPGYDHDRMIAKLEQGLAYKVTQRTTTSDYLALFSEIYNYGVNKNNKVYFHLD